MEEYDLVKCIDRALDPFGSSVKHAIFLNMSFLHDSDTSEVISDSAMLSRVIEEMSGESAWKIAKSIIHEISKTFDLSSEETRNLIATVDAARQRLAERVSSTTPRTNKILTDPPLARSRFPLEFGSKGRFRTYDTAKNFNSFQQ